MAEEVPIHSGSERWRRQVAALSSFGGRALRSDNLDGLLLDAASLVSDALEVELVKVLEVLPSGKGMLLRAGVNWKPGVVGRATFGTDGGSPGGYALKTAAPVISNDVATEDRFGIPALLVEHGVRSMVNVVIRGAEAPWGVLEVDARRPRRFDEDDVAFLQNYANLLAFAIERVEIQAKLADVAHRRHILLGELQHRVGNMLANIRALARRTRINSPDLDGFAAAFDARLQALARTQTQMTRDPSGTARLRDVLREELQAHGAQEGGRLALAGPDAVLPYRIAQVIGMAFHELATNASKHGALARPEGRIDVTWEVAPIRGGEEMRIRWRERGVAIERPPERRGFGSETIEQSLPYMLGGAAAMVFHEDGLECDIRFPLPLSTAATETGGREP